LSRTSNRNNGFTLIEVMVAVALTAVLLVALYSAFFSIAGAGRKAGDRAESFVEAGRLIDRFTTEVRSAYFRRGDTRTFFQGGNKGGDSELSFTTFTFPVATGAPTSDLVAVNYHIEKDGLEKRLVKEVWNPYLGTKMGFSAIRDIREFEVSYFNGKDWSKAWEATIEGSAPRAVRIRIVLPTGEEIVQTGRLMIR